MTGPEVLALRQRMGIRQVDLASKAGVSERTVQRWEQDGCSEPISRLLAKLEEADLDDKAEQRWRSQ